MAPERPGWRPYFDAFERAVGRPLETGVQTDTFQDALAVAGRLQVAVRHRLERASTDFLHTFNLPAQSDVRRLSEQLSRLEKQVRDLRLDLEKRAEGTGRGGRRK